MSFVTTPIRSSAPSARQRAATRELFPDPTGPPIPIRKARSGGKEPPLARGVGERSKLECGSEPAREQTWIISRVERDGSEPFDLGAGIEQPARGECTVDRQQAYGRGGHHGGIFVEVGLCGFRIAKRCRGRNNAECNGPRARAL